MVSGCAARCSSSDASSIRASDMARVRMHEITKPSLAHQLTMEDLDTWAFCFDNAFCFEFLFIHITLKHT